jgi:hypothetical protein
LEGKFRGKICAFEAEINKYVTKLGNDMMFVLVIESPDVFIATVMLCITVLLV